MRMGHFHILTCEIAIECEELVPFLFQAETLVGTRKIRLTVEHNHVVLNRDRIPLAWIW